MKNDYDSAIEQVFDLADKVFENVEAGGLSEVCKIKMAELQNNFEVIKPTVMSEVGLSVVEPKPRAKAYLETMNTIPLSLLVAQVALSNLGACGQVN